MDEVKNNTLLTPEEKTRAYALIGSGKLLESVLSGENEENVKILVQSCISENISQPANQGKSILLILLLFLWNHHPPMPS